METVDPGVQQPVPPDDNEDRDHEDQEQQDDNEQDDDNE